MNSFATMKLSYNNAFFTKMMLLLFIPLIYLTGVLQGTSSDTSDFDVDSFLNLSPDRNSIAKQQQQQHSIPSQYFDVQPLELENLSNKEDTQNSPKQVTIKKIRTRKSVEHYRRKDRERGKRYRDALKTRPEVLAIQKEKKRLAAQKRYQKTKSDPKKYEEFKLKKKKYTQLLRSKDKKAKC